jgi:metallo-beta-lactamase family protein
MMEAGRILQHLRYSVEDKKNGILFTGFAGEDTLGGKIARGQKKVWIMNELYEVKAKVFKLQEYSAHADRNDIVQFLSCQDKNKVMKIFLVHGQPKTQKKLKDTLLTLGYKNVEVAMPHMHYPL